MFIDFAFGEFDQTVLGWKRTVVFGKDALFLTDESPKEKRKSAFTVFASSDKVRMVKLIDSGRVDAIHPRLDLMKLDKGLVRIAKKAGVPILLGAGPLLRNKTLLKKYGQVCTLLAEIDAPIILATMAGNEFEVRGPFELRALFGYLGLNETQMAYGLKALPQLLLEIKEKRASELAPGVRIV